MTFFSEERAAELREVFFESSQEILQGLNECGLALEKHADDPAILRRVRRALHTLKGDAAACGYLDMSKLAHDLEDAFSAELPAGKTGALAELVLTAADTFHAMLSAYRENILPPPSEAVRACLQQYLGQHPGQHPAQHSAPHSAQHPGGGPSTLPPAEHSASRGAQFGWSEYEQMMIEEAVARGEAVYNVALEIVPDSPLRAAALQLVRNVLHACGSILALRPDDNVVVEDVKVIEAAVASSRSRDWIEQKCAIPSVVSAILIEKIEDSEMKIVESGQAHLVPQAVPPSSVAALHTVENSLRVDTARIDAVMNLVGELIIGKSALQQIVSEFEKRLPRDPLRSRFVDALAFQSRVLGDLQKSVMKIRMVPVEQLFRRFPRVVRDVAKSCGKDVALTVSGQQTDLDKSILDALAEPMAHLVRNAVGHGIEPSEERIAAGKPARGMVRLKAYHQGNQVVIEVGDDGRGIDSASLLSKAIERGIITREEAARLSPAESLNLVFQPGLSTASQVTEISGRGVGMDVVRTALEHMKGSVRIESKPGVGTTFLLMVPLTLASIQALLFRAGDQLYAVPLTMVLEITRATEDEIHRVDNREVLRLRDQVLTVVRLDRLARTRPVAVARRLYVVVVAVADRKFALLVDRMVGEEELVMKSLDGCLFDAEMVSGASILGDGTVVLILNLPAVTARLGKAQPLEATA
ncbi:MAG: chemotaxis protein CheA [Acidipila sp.]|nr:chemotaxis protein CheA [Acidipila sp.]